MKRGNGTRRTKREARLSRHLQNQGDSGWASKQLSRRIKKRKRQGSVFGSKFYKG